MNEQKVIRFPSYGRSSRGAAKLPDEKMAADIRSAWRKLWRTINTARAAGLTVETTASEYDAPKIERRL